MHARAIQMLVALLVLVGSLDGSAPAVRAAAEAPPVRLLVTTGASGPSAFVAVMVLLIW